MSGTDHLARTMFVQRHMNLLACFFYCGRDLTGSAICETWPEVRGHEIRSGAVQVTLGANCQDPAAKEQAEKYRWQLQAIEPKAA